MSEHPGIGRIWRGWTTVENADAYEHVVGTEVLPAIIERRIEGLVGASLMRSVDVVDGEVEFTTVIWFEDLESVTNFMGEDYRTAHVPPNARAVLKRYEPEAKHFTLIREYA